MRLTELQENLLSEHCRESFTERLLLFINEFFPEHFYNLSENEIQDKIESWINFANLNNIKSEKNICLYVSTLLSSGFIFDKNTQSHWLYEISTSNAYNSEDEKIEDMLRKAEKQFR